MCESHYLSQSSVIGLLLKWLFSVWDHKHWLWYFTPEFVFSLARPVAAAAAKMTHQQTPKLKRVSGTQRLIVALFPLLTDLHFAASKVGNIEDDKRAEQLLLSASHFLLLFIRS